MPLSGIVDNIFNGLDNDLQNCRLLMFFYVQFTDKKQ